MQEFCRKAIKWLFIAMIGLALLCMCGADFFNYHLERTFLIPNTITALSVALLLFLFFKFVKSPKKTKPITDKKYWLVLGITMLVVYLIQLIMIYCLYFYTDWDVEYITTGVDRVIEEGSLGKDAYFSIYPNNVMLVAIFAAIRSIPILGNHYTFLLAVNALFVLLAGIFTCLTIKKLTSNRISLLSLIIIIPLLLLNPWFLIPYSDTVAILFPIIIFFLYLKKEKRWWDYVIIGCLSMLGYYIKPTVIILLIAIAIVAIMRNLSKLKDICEPIGATILGIFMGFLIGSLVPSLIHFDDQGIRPITFVHYLAMGQNDETLGAWSGEDVAESLENGVEYDIEKFWNRLTTRSLGEQISFFIKKYALNFNDGTFGWSAEGSFYKTMVDRDDELSLWLREIYYSNGKYYKIFMQTVQILWVIVLELCLIFAWRNKNGPWPIYILMLTLLGLTAFLMIFEPRTRYLYCFMPIYITCAVIGINSSKNKTKDKTKPKKI